MARVSKIDFVNEATVNRLGRGMSETEAKVFHRTDDYGEIWLHIYSYGERPNHPGNKSRASQNLAFSKDQMRELRDYLNQILEE